MLQRDLINGNIWLNITAATDHMTVTRNPSGTSGAPGTSDNEHESTTLEGGGPSMCGDFD